jgi:hypothetical protein
MASTLLLPLAEASAKLFGVFIENWSTSRNKDRKQVKVGVWLNKHYESLRDEITNDSVHLLAHAEFGEGLTITSARRAVYPYLSLPPSKLKLFNKEFHYRLEYLVLLGLLRRGVKEYHITRLGVTFLAMARAKGHYGKVLKTK